MNCHGAETWLMNVMRNIDRNTYQFDFLVHSEKNYDYSDEIRSLGGRLIVCKWPSWPFSYARDFGRILERCGPYDVIHNHVNHFGGWILEFAKSHHIPRRIAHSHSAQPPENVPWFLRSARALENRFTSGVTDRLAVSKIAARSQSGPRWAEVANARILSCAIDLSRFDKRADRSIYRRRLGVREDSFVIGHVGRFTAVKNHAFIIEIANAAPNTQFLFVGDGPLMSKIQRMAKDLGLSERIVFAGVRADVPELMQTSMDAFVMPSHYEGLCLAAIEAQAAGLICVVADTLPPESVVCPELVTRLTLQDSPATWAAALLAARTAGDRWRRSEQGADAVRQSRFNIRRNIQDLIEVYSGSTH
jgi:glycosyltransferase involved in cell wall biosynthesis